VLSKGIKDNKMKTIILDTPGHFRATETESPRDPAPNEALVRVRRVGICGTDLHAFRGKQPFFSYPRILGHELGVEIVAIGANDRGLKVGDKCAVEPSLNCGRCIACRRGRSNCCENLQVMGVHVDGGMREVVNVPISKLHKSAKLTLDQLALVETLAIGAHAVNRGAPERGETVLVIGAGPIGLSVIQFAKAAETRVIVMDVNEGRLNFCRENLGVALTVDARADALRRLQDAAGGELPTLVFDATGNPASMMASFQFVAHSGRLVFVGLVQADITFNDPHFHRREITLFASRNSTSSDFERIIRMMEAGEIDTKPWITHRAGCGEMIGQFERWLDPTAGVIKAMVEF
jgi:2-desacetyl-2-hydroxyethyl bacteriochlorophyllide A dehydrogenase